ncbi:MAG: DUF294 nucleotidyltransferase-like domain-containing protein [Anaerolineae bacterium]|nr:DUF294 nucleotidyltransferase-like domain-containing protein [Anaerolineae bacterium]
MIQQITIDFLRKHAPYDLLGDSELTLIAKTASLDFFPSETRIYTQENSKAESLYLIQKGCVRMTAQDANGQDILMDMRSEGESFGILSLLNLGTALMTVTTLEDTLCYLIPKNTVQTLMQNQRFSEYFLRGSTQRYLMRTLNEMRQSRQRGEGSLQTAPDRLIFTTAVRHLVKRQLVWCVPDTSIRQAAQMMAKHKIGSIIVALQDHASAPVQPLGIVTDTDLRNKVIAEGHDAGLPIRGIMTSPVKTIDGDQLAFEALLRMINASIHSLLVVDGNHGNAVLGMVTQHDLILLQSNSPLIVSKQLRRDASVADLAKTLNSAHQFIPLMVKEGVNPGGVGRVVAEVNDQVLSRLLSMAERTLGAPPLPYCWVVLGSEGRKEQTFKTDQDNGLIYADPNDEAQAEAASAYFERFASWVNDALIQCGFPRCPGNYMASNPRWRQPLSQWRKTYLTWINTPEPTDVMNATIFFDMRPAGGDESLVEALLAEVLPRAQRAGRFMGHLARLAVQNTPPVGFFRSFLLESTGPHKGAFDIKKRGVMPLTDAIRLYAIANGVRATNTLERLEDLRKADVLASEQIDEMKDTLEFLALLRLKHQVEQAANGEKPDNFINPNELSSVERSTLRETFQVISNTQADLSDRYRGFMNSAV